MHQARNIAPRLVVLGCGIAIVAAACGTGATPSVRTVENSGEVCLQNPPDSGETDGVDTGELRAQVVFDTCISSTCDEIQDKNCSARIDGSKVVIESEAEILSKGGTCSPDCGIVSATCEVPALESGEYRLEHGDKSRTFQLPSDEAICLGSGP